MALTILCIAATLFAVASGNLIQHRAVDFTTFNFKHLISKNDLVELQRSSRAEQVAIMNDYIDDFLVELNGFIAEMGSDTVKVGDLGGKVGWSIFTGEMSLTNGSVKGLNTIARANDVKLKYEYPVLKVSFPLKLENVNMNYDYAVNLMNFGPYGLLNVTAQGCQVLLEAQIDMITLLAKLDQYQLESLGDVTLEFQGGVVEWMVNLFVSVALPLVKPVLRWVINTFTQGTVASLIDTYNEAITKIMESINL